MALPKLKIGHYTSHLPIIQGGMGIRISGANLAAAVANEGGIGIISAIGLGMNSPYFNPAEPNFGKRKKQFLKANQLALRDELKKARKLSPQGILGVNVMVAVRDYEALVRTAVEYGANLIISGAGLPFKLPEYTSENKAVALVPIISSTRAAKIICQKWQRNYARLPDAIVVENPRYAGGHLGAKTKDLNEPSVDATSVIPELLSYIHHELDDAIPIIAAGGIGDRGDIHRALELGAKGVQIGTRFITTYECDADDRYKVFHLNAKPDEVVIISSPVGLPGRALQNTFVQQVLAEGTSNPQETCFVDCLKMCKFRDNRETYCILRALDRASRGDVETGLIFSGSNAGKAQHLISVAQLMHELTGIESGT